MGDCEIAYIISRPGACHGDVLVASVFFNQHCAECMEHPGRGSSI